MGRRYSIWGREYGSDHDVELAQCDSNPEAVRRGLELKMLTIKHGLFVRGRRTSKVRKYVYLRIVDNAHDGSQPTSG
ncbi:hypothetical protein ABID65_006681 [Bradyrhizobium sp. S3.9.2]|uniref:hypothetical protein n=1 Tax=Bradyrhizobium sp. S3.9.2 TaxID=3156432 RepID=UPI00339A4249